MTKCWCSDARRILICGSAIDDRGCRRSSLKLRTNTELDGGQRANIASKSGSHGSGESPPIDHHFGHAHCSKLHVSAVSRCCIIISAGGFSDVIHIHRERDSRFLRMAPEWVMSHSKRLMGPALWNKLHTWKRHLPRGCKDYFPLLVLDGIFHGPCLICGGRWRLAMFLGPTETPDNPPSSL